jgi:lipoate---protein ligase
VITSLIEQRGSVAQLHALDPFEDGSVDAPQVWWCRPDRDAIVLGSRQSPDLIDLAACNAAGLEVVRRRSGGGLVIVRRDAMVWIDLVLPSGVAPEDVRGAMVWAGELWRAALVEVAGADPGRLQVHRGGMVDTDWSALVCFAGIGPGEVLDGGAKLVGLSQRRTRAGARIQGLIHTSSWAGEDGRAAEYSRLVSATVPAGVPPLPAVLAVDGGRVAAVLSERLS